MKSKEEIERLAESQYGTEIGSIRGSNPCMESSWYDRYLRLFINPIADICGAGILAIILAFAYISFSDITIKSVTHCPTCNSECKVNGSTTQYYVPVKKYTEEDMLKCWNTAFIDAMYIDSETYKPIFYSDFINSLNKQDNESN